MILKLNRVQHSTVLVDSNFRARIQKLTKMKRNCLYSAKLVKGLFADVVHVSNYWILAKAMAHAPVPHFDVP